MIKPFCTCPQDGTDRNSKTKITKADSENNCVYCGYAVIYKETDKSKKNKSRKKPIDVRFIYS